MANIHQEKYVTPSITHKLETYLCFWEIYHPLDSHSHVPGLPESLPHACRPSSPHTFNKLQISKFYFVEVIRNKKLQWIWTATIACDRNVHRDICSCYYAITGSLSVVMWIKEHCEGNPSLTLWINTFTKVIFRD